MKAIEGSLADTVRCVIVCQGLATLDKQCFLLKLSSGLGKQLARKQWRKDLQAVIIIFDRAM